VKSPRLYPPVWFLANLGMILGIRHFTPTPLSLPDGFTGLGPGVIWFGALFALASMVSFRIHHTSVIPFRPPEVLMRTGLFRWSRNPIYLGEAFILTGMCIKFGHALPWLMIPVFMLGATRGFIKWEEATLRQKFGAAFEDYCRQTRRWL
jgi:protein-S-isoprenylcysteine O-methyltransferase Ste14